MAKDKIAVRVNLRQNTNQKSDQYGHYYPYLDKNHTLSLRGLAKHISDHGSIYTRDVVQGVLTQLSECIPELCAQGIPVKIDGLGTFSPYIESTKEGVAQLSDAQGASPEDFVAGVHVGEVLDVLGRRRRDRGLQEPAEEVRPAVQEDGYHEPGS